MNYGVDAPAQFPEIRKKQQVRCQYDGKNFDSIYEIAYFIWLTDNNIPFIYEPNVRFKYCYDGKSHWYMPDFLVADQYVEIKGDHFFNEDGTMCNPYDNSQDGLYEAKHRCMIENDVKIMKISEMKDIVKYVKSKYGNDFLKKCRKSSKKV